MSNEFVIELPQWLIDRLEVAADIAKKSIEEVALSIFASEVVHT